VAREFTSGNGKRGAADLAPLERDCMNMLWPAGEATVRDIQAALAPTRPRAYTTIMTIMDRLAHKGIVERRKVGKAYVYRPNLTAEQARARAVENLVENYFHGSRDALETYLGGGPFVPRRAAVPRERVLEPRDRAAAPQREPAVPTESAAGPPMDDTLL